ncbi:pentatricopeptide repeat-containing protein At3g12770-like [Zingiber officinale]|uniref:pentatricopeptide repeat-containing protein At3g12770-like n=1 Tax=Zingiber officinale TaxID=94328 RepID=UPI001C4BEB8C|nr:pentatricopeptide repeat-containing protein At3g12770-like [Zingiber officinale]
MPRRCLADGLSSTFLSSCLRKSASSSSLRDGREAHAQVVARGFLPHVTLETDLVLMYARCSGIHLARMVFDRMPQRNMHSWNILLSSYAQMGPLADQLGVLSLPRSLLRSGLLPDHFTLPSLFKVCAAVRDHFRGMAFHNWAICLGHEGCFIVRGSIMDMYAKCGLLDDARYLFETMPRRDSATWNSIVSGYARLGCSAEALALYRRRSKCEVEEDFMAIPSILSACAREGDLRRGKEVHGRATRCLLFDCDVTIGNSLIDMYAKCGCVGDAQKVFSRMSRQNLVTWSTLISCYGAHGDGYESLRLYQEMLERGMKPNRITFTSILSSCSHSGLVSQGMRIFESMQDVHSVEPGVEHYACLVDLIGRSGRIKEALDIIQTMPMEPTSSVWGALLGACVMHRNIKVGEIASSRLFELEERNASNYVALCGIHEALGQLDCVAKLRTKMRKLGMVKKPGCSWLDADGKLQIFYQGDAVNPQVNDILVLECLHLLAMPSQ